MTLKILYRNCLLCAYIFLIASSNNAYGQEAIQDSKNILKINLLGLATRSISLQGERAIAPHFSAALGVRFQPKGKLPFRNLILNNLDSFNITARDFVDKIRMSSWAITPEFRYYVGKRPMTGFYLGPFLQFGQYKISWDYLFIDDNGDKKTVGFVGSSNSFAYGLQLGAQFRVAKRYRIDWWIAGPLNATLNTHLDADVDLSDLDQFEKKRLEVLLNGFAVNGNHLNTVVSNDGVVGDIKLSTLGLRTGLCIGIAY